MEPVDGFEPPDLLITNQLLYHLSYTGKKEAVADLTATASVYQTTIQQERTFVGRRKPTGGTCRIRTYAPVSGAICLANRPLKPLE